MKHKLCISLLLLVLAFSMLTIGCVSEKKTVGYAAALPSQFIAARTYWLNDTTINSTADEEALLKEPNTAIPTVAHSVTVKSTDNFKLLDRYVTEVGEPGFTIVPGNEWRFFNYASVDSNTGINTITVVCKWKLASGGYTPEFINTTSEPFTSTTPAQYAQSRVAVPRQTINTTDRLVVEYYAQTTSSANRIITLYHNGKEYYTHVATYT